MHAMTKAFDAIIKRIDESKEAATLFTASQTSVNQCFAHVHMLCTTMLSRAAEMLLPSHLTFLSAITRLTY
jgi:hypothetical protein